MKARPQSWKERHKAQDKEKDPLVECPTCKQKHKKGRNGLYCNMSCYYRGNKIEG